MTPEQRSLHARLANHVRWANEPDRTAATAPARNALRDSFERKVDPDCVLDPRERAIRAEHARKAHYLKMALASSRARSARKEQRGGEAA